MFRLALIFYWLMTETVVSGLLPEHIRSYQDQLINLIQKPLERTGADKYYSANDVLDNCIKQEWQCWVACSQAEIIDCVFITHITPHPTGYKEFTIYLVGGRNLGKWLPQAWGLFKRYAKAHGCKGMAGGGRKGWLRALKRVEHNEFEHQLNFTVEI